MYSIDDQVGEKRSYDDFSGQNMSQTHNTDLAIQIKNLEKNTKAMKLIFPKNQPVKTRNTHEIKQPAPKNKTTSSKSSAQNFSQRKRSGSKHSIAILNPEKILAKNIEINNVKTKIETSSSKNNIECIDVSPDNAKQWDRNPHGSLFQFTKSGLGGITTKPSQGICLIFKVI